MLVLGLRLGPVGGGAMLFDTQGTTPSLLIRTLDWAVFGFIICSIKMFDNIVLKPAFCYRKLSYVNTRNLNVTEHPTIHFCPWETPYYCR